MRNGMKGSKASTMIAMTAGILVLTMGTPAFAGGRLTRPDFAPPIVKKFPGAPVQVPPQKTRPGVKGGPVGVLGTVASIAGALSDALDGAINTVQFTLQSTAQAGAGCNDDTTPY